jgi:hypothetical protein
MGWPPRRDGRILLPGRGRVKEPACAIYNWCAVYNFLPMEVILYREAIDIGVKIIILNLLNKFRKNADMVKITRQVVNILS